MNLNQPVPELPVADVEKAQEYYCTKFGCTSEWLVPSKELGAVFNGETGLFFRQRDGYFEPTVHWIYADEVDQLYAEMVQSGANIVDAIENKPWGLRQFSVQDLDGNLFHLHHDLASAK